MEIMEPINPRIQIRVRGLRKDASTLSEKNVRGEVDVSQAAMGRRVFPLNRNHIFLPNERLYIVAIEPPQITFQFRTRPRPSEPPPS